MTTPTKQSELQQLLDQSRGFHFLVPSYQQALREAADTGELGLQKALTVILRREKPSDLQSVYFTEEVLQNFVEKNLGVNDRAALVNELRNKARHLINAFLFFTVEQKQEILPYIDTLDLEQVKKLIDLYKLGHHKQEQYLRIFAQKDPLLAMKFEAIIDSDRRNKSTDQNKA